MEDALNQYVATPPKEHLSPKSTHALEQASITPKIVEKLIKIKVSDTISAMMKKLKNRT